MTVSEAIRIIVELKTLAAKLGHDFAPDWDKLRAQGFSSHDLFTIEARIDRHMRASAWLQAGAVSRLRRLRAIDRGDPDALRDSDERN